MISPKPFCKDQDNIKAFVLGCDPTAIINGEKLRFEYVFDINDDKRYFSGILRNLKILGLDLSNIYVQNLVTEYQDKETSKNSDWDNIAKEAIAMRKEEFDLLDKTGTTPVFLTSEKLYHVLLHESEKHRKALELYSDRTNIPIKPEQNLLRRPLVPLYRHYRYQLEKWPEYSNLLRQTIT